MSGEDFDSEDFDFQGEVGDLLEEVEEIEVEDVEEDDHDAMADGAPRQEHVDSAFTATTATTDEDGTSFGTYPTPTSQPKQRIVELSRGFDSEDDSDGYTADAAPQTANHTSNDTHSEENDEVIEDDEVSWEQLPTQGNRADENRGKPHHPRFPAEKPLRSRDPAEALEDEDSDPGDPVDEDVHGLQPTRFPMAARDGTTTYENWMTVRMGPGQWQERYGVIQPSSGLFAFDDDIAANDWRRSDRTAGISYESRLLISCEQLTITSDADLSAEAEEATQGEYSLSFRLSNDKEVVIVIAVADAFVDEWTSALEGARPLADYFVSCEKLGIAPAFQLIRAALTSPPLRALDCEGQNLSDADHLEALCQFAISSGRLLHKVRLHKCQLTEESALLLRGCLMRLPALQELDLSDNPRLKETGVCAILEGVFHNRLRILNLRNCDVGDEAAMEISEVVARSPSLERLDVGENRISALGGVRLALSLAHCSQLQELCFGDNPELQDEFVGALSSVLPSLQLLTKLDLSGIRLSDWGLHYLERGLKDTTPMESQLNDSSDSAGRIQLEQVEWERIDLRNNPTITEPVAALFLERLSEFLSVDDVVLFSFPVTLRTNNRLELGETPRLLAMKPMPLSPAIKSPSSSSFVVVTFAGSPVPTKDRLRDVLQQALGIRPGRIRIKKQVMKEEDENEEDEDFGKEKMIVEFTEDPTGALASKAVSLMGETKLALLRVESIRRQEGHQDHPEVEDRQLMVTTSRDNALIALAGRDSLSDEPLSLVTLEMLTVSLSEVLFTPSESNMDRIRKHFDAIKHTLSPLLRRSLELVCAGPHPGTGESLSKAIISSASGLSLSCDAAIAKEMTVEREYDMISAVGCAAVLGDLKRMRAAVTRRTAAMQKDEIPSFAKRLGDILVHSYPYRFASEFPLKSYGRLIDPSARPLTRPLPGAQLQLLSAEEQDALYAQHQSGCERVFKLIQTCLGYEERKPDDVDGSAAMNELFGVALSNPSLIAELHLDLVLRTCQSDTTKGKPTAITWVLALLALRCVPLKQKGLTASIDARLHLALLASYKNYYDRTQEPMALNCIRALESTESFNNSFIITRPMRRLEYIRRCVRIEKTQMTIHLPDGRGVLVDPQPFGTMLGLLVAVDAKLLAPAPSTNNSASPNLERWRGFHFVERFKQSDKPAELQEEFVRLLPYGEDPTWWFACSKSDPARSNAKLCLEPIVVPGLVPLLSESDPQSLDEQFKGDAVRIALSFATEKSSLKQQTMFCSEVRAVAYCAVIACIEQLGEDRFRVCSLSEFLRICEAQFPVSIENLTGGDDEKKATGFREAINDFRSSLLAMPRGSFPKNTCRSALVNYARLWPMSGTFGSVVYPKQTCIDGTVVDASLPPVARLSVSVRGGLLLAPSSGDYRCALWSCDLRSLSRIEYEPHVCELWFVCAGEEDWVKVRFSSETQAQTFRQAVLCNIWAVLSYSGVALPRMRWLEEFTFRFPQFPSPPAPPRQALPPGGVLRTRISKTQTEIRLAAHVIVDQLFRTRFSKSSLPIGAFFFGPLEQSDISSIAEVFPTKQSGSGAMLMLTADDSVDALLALPPLSPPPPPSHAFSPAFPLPYGRPEEDEDIDDGIIIQPPSHPPPPPSSSAFSFSPSSFAMNKDQQRSAAQKRSQEEALQTPMFIPLPPMDAPPPISFPPPDVAESQQQPPIVIPGPTADATGGNIEETEEQAKARLKREFLKKRREKEQQQEQTETG